jgi:hypothetical protein
LPFIRYVRDKRGYEHTYVMHGYRAGQGAARARVLYVFSIAAEYSRRPQVDGRRSA